jgi:hypothetical protein
MATKPWHLPVRIAAGAYIIDQGLSKRDLPDEAAGWFKQQAVVAFPELFEKMEPKQFVALLATSEIALGSALLAVPLVPPFLAGLGLTAFAGCLNRVYLRSPEYRRDGSLAPSMQGIGNAKDAWLTAMGLALILDSLFAPRRHR